MKTLIGLAAAAVLLTSTTFAAVSEKEAARLGVDLTPLGGEKAGNADGTIPAWTGGLRSPADAGFPNYRSPDHYPDPFANDKPLFTITTANLAQYAAKLTEGRASNDRALREALLAFADDSDAMVRFQAALALGDVADASAIDGQRPAPRAQPLDLQQVAVEFVGHRHETIVERVERAVVEGKALVEAGELEPVVLAQSFCACQTCRP